VNDESKGTSSYCIVGFAARMDEINKTLDFLRFLEPSIEVKEFNI